MTVPVGYNRAAAFPTHVGVNRRAGFFLHPCGRIPHTRGGEPLSAGDNLGYVGGGQDIDVLRPLLTESSVIHDLAYEAIDQIQSRAGDRSD